MASLKDMRVRIAATKATQKITKAMQMVAASKLRRAQAAAEAARPYAERMGKVLGNIAAAIGDLGTAPKLLLGTGGEGVHLLVVCTAERGLCGPFNSAIVRLARERANALLAEGKEIKLFCVGRKGYEQLRRLYQRQIIEHIELRAVRTLAFEHAEEIGDVLDRLLRQPATRLLLRAPQQRNDRGGLSAFRILVDLALGPIEILHREVEALGLKLGRGEATDGHQRSTSPNTMSSEPRIADTSASM